METTSPSRLQPSVYYPPGGILVWLLIILEIFTFLGAILIFMYYRGQHIQEFVASRELLNPIIGTINTIVLMTSGYQVANAIHQLRNDANVKSANSLLRGMILGLVFLVIKGVEYYIKLEQGLDFGHSTFFTFYWLITGFHFVHVLFGVGLLAYMYSAVKRKSYTSTHLDDVEASAVYWHMCDLIWILIFPILYLI